MSRWVLAALLTLGLVAIAPAAGASTSTATSGQRPELTHAIVLAGLERIAVAAPANHVLAHQLRSGDAAFIGEASTPSLQRQFCPSSKAVPQRAAASLPSSAPRAPPAEGLA